jgi:class 3 adenylate cyclase
MAIFGAPVGQPDDAARAVAAGLAMLEAIRDLDAQQPSRRARGSPSASGSTPARRSSATSARPGASTTPRSATR